jgi:hypothetical protein
MRKLLRRIHYVLHRRRAATELAEEIEAQQLRWPLGAGVALGLAAAIPVGQVMFVA